MNSHAAPSSADGHAALSAATPKTPEDSQIFRLAQLVILLEKAEELRVPIPTIDRLGYYDFFSANPFVVIGEDDNRDASDRLALYLEGFSEKQLSYASTGQRFASRRRRLQHDLSLLIAYGLAIINATGYRLTPTGRELASALTSVYADSYRVAAEIVIRRLGRLNNKRLRESVEVWLGKSWLLIDFLEDIRETTPGSID